MSLIPNNPADKVSPPKVEKFVGKFYTVDQIEKLLQIVKGTPIETPVFITAHYGLRRGEVLGLRWEDINFEEKTLSICNTRVRFNSTIYTKAPKNESSRRTLPLMDTVAEYLKKLREEQLGLGSICGNQYVDSGYVCCWQNGKPLDLTYINHKLNALLHTYKMPHIRFHDLRHTFATRPLELNERPKVVQEMLGHANISVTLDTYSHVMPELKKDAAAKPNHLFEGIKNNPSKEEELFKT